MEATEISRYEDYIDKAGKVKFSIKLDLLEGFWQVPLAERSKKIF